MDLGARIEATCAAVERPDAASMAAARERLDTLTKPPRSLGRLEDLVVRLAGMQASALPDVRPGTVVVAAADHGVACQGVSAYPSEVTAQMVGNFLAGGAAISALARQAGLRVRVVDVGVAADIGPGGGPGGGPVSGPGGGPVSGPGAGPGGGPGGGPDGGPGGGFGGGPVSGPGGGPDGGPGGGFGGGLGGGLDAGSAVPPGGGLAVAPGGAEALTARKVRRGTADFTRGPAMRREEALQAVVTGIDLAEEEATRGTRLLVPGEMGIGNSTAAAALLAALAGVPVERAVGRGTGVDDAGLERKREAVRTALARHRPDATDVWDVLAKLGGLEIACLAGLILGAAARRIPVLLDGFISTAAALVATRAEPRAGAYLIAAHRSAEPGHALLLRLLGLEPLLQLDLRLGEGSGAAAAAPLLQGACAFMREMATFAEAGVAGGPHPAAPGTRPSPPPAALGEPRQGRPAAAAGHASDGSAGDPRGEDTDDDTDEDTDDTEGNLRGGDPGWHAFPPAQRDGVYRAIDERRDMRSFRPDPVPEATVQRLLQAAHHAPSVGFMQPWRFVLVRDAAAKAALKALVERERQAQGRYFEGDRAALFPRLKVDGIAEAPLVICVCVDPTSGGRHVLGRHSEPATDVYSAACAVENLWLAARAEGIGVGWVTFYRKPDVRHVLGIPPHVDPIALLCVGYVDAFPPRPVLELAGWERRLPLAAVVFRERWDAT